MSRAQINFRVSEEEKSRWEKAAAKSKLPLGTWIKNALEASAAGAPKPPKEIAFDIPRAAHAGDDAGTGETLPRDEQDLGESEKDKREIGGGSRNKAKAKTCSHGRPRGHHCGLCGGKAKVK